MAGVDLADRAATESLLASREPGVRYRARVELMGDDPSSPEMQELAATIADGRSASALLQFEDRAAYDKWRGNHWRLVALVELGVPADNADAQTALDRVLEEWASEAITRPHVVDGLVREHASVFGNALGVAARLGAERDDRAARIADALCAWQWPDGGWNCDNNASGRRSSFHESLATTWGLAEFHRAVGEPRAEEAARASAELFLSHQVFRNSRTGVAIDDCFTHLHWPPYWHFDFLQCLRVLTAIDGSVLDPRCADAFELLRAKRGDDHSWRADARWWKPPESQDSGRHGAHGPDPGDGSCFEAVAWEETEAEMLTLNALIAKKLAGATADPGAVESRS